MQNDPRLALAKKDLECGRDLAILLKDYGLIEDEATISNVRKLFEREFGTERPHFRLGRKILVTAYTMASRELQGGQVVNANFRITLAHLHAAIEELKWFTETSPPGAREQAPDQGTGELLASMTELSNLAIGLATNITP